MNKSFSWDVFVSHNLRQKSWVRETVKQFRNLGINVFFDEDSLEPGEPIITGIERGINGSRHIALVVSPSSMVSPWVALEIANTLYIDPDSSQRRLIPVLLEDTHLADIRLTVRSLNHIDLTKPENRTQQYHRLIRFLKPDCEHFPTPPEWDQVTGMNTSQTPPTESRIPEQTMPEHAKASSPSRLETPITLQSFDSSRSSDLLATEEASREIDRRTEAWLHAKDQDTKTREAAGLIAKLDEVLAIIRAKEQGYDALRQGVTRTMKRQRELVLKEIASKQKYLEAFPEGLHVDSLPLYWRKKAVKKTILSLQEDAANLNDIIKQLETI